MFRSRTSRWTLTTAGLSLVLLAAAWFLLIGPRQAQASDLDAQRVATEKQNDELEARISELRAQFAKLPAQRAELAAVLRQIPAASDIPQLVRDVNSLADASGVTVDSLSRSPAASVTAAPATAATLSSANSSASVRLFQIPLTIVVHGDFFQAVAFLQKVQTQLPRAVLINGVQVAPYTSSGGSAGQVQVGLSSVVYVWPDGASVTVPAQVGAATTSAAASAVPTTGATSIAPQVSSAGGTP